MGFTPYLVHDVSLVKQFRIPPRHSFTFRFKPDLVKINELINFNKIVNLYIIKKKTVISIVM